MRKLAREVHWYRFVISFGITLIAYIILTRTDTFLNLSDSLFWFGSAIAVGDRLGRAVEFHKTGKLDRV